MIVVIGAYMFSHHGWSDTFFFSIKYTTYVHNQS